MSKWFKNEYIFFITLKKKDRVHYDKKKVMTKKMKWSLVITKKWAEKTWDISFFCFKVIFFWQKITQKTNANHLKTVFSFKKKNDSRIMRSKMIMTKKKQVQNKCKSSFFLFQFFFLKMISVCFFNKKKSNEWIFFITLKKKTGYDLIFFCLIKGTDFS